jgi:hypothetical protein
MHVECVINNAPLGAVSAKPCPASRRVRRRTVQQCRRAASHLFQASRHAANSEGLIR